MSEGTRNRRWYHLAPDRFFAGLLVVQVSLLLSERFQWFAFNEKKGWTVLIAIGVVGVAVLVMPAWGLVCLLLRRRFQFGVRSLLAFVVVFSIPLGWFVSELQKARKQRAAVDAIAKLGGCVWYDYRINEDFFCVCEGEPTAPTWLRNVLGEDFFCEVKCVMCHMDFDDNNAMHLQELTNLERLYLADTDVTDNGLAHLEKMARLEVLWLAGTQVTDAGVKRLQQALPKCEMRRSSPPPNERSDFRKAVGGEAPHQTTLVKHPVSGL